MVTPLVNIPFPNPLSRIQNFRPDLLRIRAAKRVRASSSFNTGVRTIYQCALSDVTICRPC